MLPLSMPERIRAAADPGALLLGGTGIRSHQRMSPSTNFRKRREVPNRWVPESDAFGYYYPGDH